MSSTEAFIHGLDEKVNKIITFSNHEFMELQIMFLNNVMLFVYFLLPDKCIFKIHSTKPEGPNLDNGSWGRC